MLERLANLTGSHPKRVLAIAFALFAIAGLFGSGVADRPDPYEADDPDTESVIAEKQLEEAGFRQTEAVVLIEGVDPESRAGDERIEEVAATTAEVEGVGRLPDSSTPRIPRSSPATATRPTSR